MCLCHTLHHLSHRNGNDHDDDGGDVRDRGHGSDTHVLPRGSDTRVPLHHGHDDALLPRPFQILLSSLLMRMSCHNQTDLCQVHQLNQL